MEMNKAVPGPSPEEITSCVEEMHAIEAQLKKIKVKLEKLQGAGSGQPITNCSFDFSRFYQYTTTSL